MKHSYPIHEHAITVAGLKLYYHTAGDLTKPPLVFLHGWGIRWNRFGPWCGIKGVIDELLDHFYVIAPELPGLIRSEAPKSYRGYEEYAHIIHALVKSIGITQPTYVMGSSFGGTIATLYAKEFPQDVRHLILVNAILSFNAGETYPWYLEWWGQAYPRFLVSLRVPRLFKKILIYLFFGTPWGHITAEALRRKQSMDDPLLYIYDMDYERIRVPVLLVWGKNDTKVPLAKALEMSQKIRQGRLITVRGGHSTLYFHPQEVIHATLANLPLPTEHL